MINETLAPACLAPWKALCIKANGQVVPDIQYQESLGNIKSDDLQTVLLGPPAIQFRRFMAQNGLGPACRNCLAKEASGGHSRRVFFNDVVLPHLPEKEPFVHSEPNIYYLEINTSNSCNLKCRMCSGHVSSAWKQDEEYLRNKLPELERPSPQQLFLGKEDIDRIFQNPSFFKNLKFLALRGGEPLFEKRNLYLLDKLKKLGLAKQITLDISTNGTVFSNDVIEALEGFESIKIYLSLEGVGELYQYIRGGNQFSTDDIEKSIKTFQTLDRAQIIFSYTSMVYNMGHINSFWQWYMSVKSPQDSISFSNLVVRPSYLNFHILPQEIKDSYAESILNGPIFKDLKLKPNQTALSIGLDSLILGLKKTQYFSNEQRMLLRSNFKKFNESLDHLRGTSFNSLLPELAEFYDSIV